jgi:ribonuclease-3
MNIEEIEKILGYEFNDKNKLIKALTRRAYAKEQGDRGLECEHQEEFSTWGDALLKAILVEELIEAECKTKGRITNKKMKVENKNTLYLIASNMGIKSHILMNKGEKQNKTNNEPKILETTLEALVAAIYYDGNFDELKRTVKIWLKKYLPDEYRDDFYETE